MEPFQFISNKIRSAVFKYTLFTNTKKVPLTIISLIIIVFSLAVSNDNVIVGFLNKAGLISLLRSNGIIKTSYGGYFKALEKQNLVYDYNRDGVVSGEDYSLFVSALSKKNLPPSPSITPTPAVSPIIDSGTESDETAEGESITLPSVRTASSNTFTGSATSSYPISLPEGMAGLRPSLSLNYSSGSVDDLYTGVETKWRNDPDHSYQRQAGIFGLGWELSGFGSISRDINGTLNEPADDKFILSFEGGFASLTYESGDSYYSVWRTAPNLKTKVERYGIPKTYDYGGGSVVLSRYFWVITAGDGTKYTFGSDVAVPFWHRTNDPDNALPEGNEEEAWFPLYEEGTNIGTRSWMLFGNSDMGYHALETRWHLYKVMNLYAVQMNYQNYFEFGEYKEKSYVQASYPWAITYGTNEVLFSYEPRLDTQTHQDDSEPVKQPQKALYRAKKINVKTSGKSIAAYTLEYKYGYDYTKHPNLIYDPQNNTYSGTASPGDAIHSLLYKITPWSSDPDS